jgi:hypothetical protein
MVARRARLHNNSDRFMPIPMTLDAHWMIVRSNTGAQAPIGQVATTATFSPHSPG